MEEAEVTYPYEKATEEQRKAGSLWWCVHHEIHLEPLTEPIENRVKYILELKPKGEHETRLLNLAPVLHPERIPERVRKARAECDKARAEYDKAWAKRDKAVAEYDKARAEYDKAWAEYAKAGAECDKARAEYAKARAEYDKAWAEYAKAGAECAKAWAEYDKARAECEPELAALHREEYPGTTWNGKSIFGGGK